MGLRALWGLLFDLWYRVSSCLLSSTKIFTSRCYQHRISSSLLPSLCSVAIPCISPLLLLPFGVAMTVALLLFLLACVVFVLPAYVVYCLRTRFLGCDRRPSRISKMLLKQHFLGMHAIDSEYI